MKALDEFAGGLDTEMRAALEPSLAMAREGYAMQRRYALLQAAAVMWPRYDEMEADESLVGCDAAEAAVCQAIHLLNKIEAQEAA
jgi:hypothetical protein